PAKGHRRRGRAQPGGLVPVPDAVDPGGRAARGDPGGTADPGRQGDAGGRPPGSTLDQRVPGHRPGRTQVPAGAYCPGELTLVQRCRTGTGAQASARGDEAGVLRSGQCSGVTEPLKWRAPERAFQPRYSTPPLAPDPPSAAAPPAAPVSPSAGDRKSTRLNSSHVSISYAVFCLKKKKGITLAQPTNGTATTF